MMMGGLNLSKSERMKSPFTTQSSAPPVETGVEMIDKILEENSLELFLNRDPDAKPYSQEELIAFLHSERAKRAGWTVKLEKAKAKKQGVEE